MARPITEENDQDLMEAWFKAEPKSIDTFIEALNHEYDHDYGTVCYATAAAGYKAAQLMAQKQGITGFQAGAVFWIFKRWWLDSGHPQPSRLINYRDFLYPQYEQSLQKTITKNTWEWLQEQAKVEMEANKDNAASIVVAHWQSIIDGVVPFGYEVFNED